MSQRYLAYIAGRWVAALSGATTLKRNPADSDDAIGLFPSMDEQDVAQAMAAAAAAFPDWSRTSPVTRGALLAQAAILLRERSETIARDLTREEGKILAEARAEVAKAADTLSYYAAFGRRACGQVLPDARAGVLAFTLREALGVVVAITPWNVPLAIPARKVAPALIAGNSVILKPATLTPLSALHLARALADAGLPPGVLNVVTGAGETLSRALISHPAVRAVSFTGSNEVGRTLQAMLPPGVRLQTEMGGKNALVVLADADLEQAVALTISGAFAASGQQCTATSRVFVEQAVYDEYLARLVTAVHALRVGPGLAEATQLGPLVSAAQLERVLTAVARARAEGARVLVGGERLQGESYSRGFFMAPTVLAEALPSMSCMQEEIFGPVVAVGRVTSLEEAIAAVNATRYGLAAAICTGSLASAHRFMQAVEAGVIGVNVPTSGWDVQLPFGGFKDSGSPFKEHAEDAVTFFSRTKTIAVQPQMP